MGIVATQSLKNIISTYLGFFIGAINTLFLYTKFLSDSYYGLVGYMLSLAFVVMPLVAFGAHNTLVKFYSSFKTEASLNSFLTCMLFLPLIVIIPIIGITYFGYDSISTFLSQKNDAIKPYLWHTVVVAISLSYFEVFYAWAKVHMQTVFGNFMKEVFHRIGVMLLLFSVYFKILDVSQFMFSLVGVYALRMVVMCVYAFKISPPRLVFSKIDNIIPILKYASLIIIAGSIATILLDIDKVMLGYYVAIEKIAYYNVAIFIAAVIAVPQRSMHQILMPLSAQHLNNKDYKALNTLYKQSSINLFIVSGLIFLLIILNINQLYHIIPSAFSGGLLVVIVISLAKLYDALLGSNNAILFNSDYYRFVLVLGVVLVVLMVLLNIKFIPLFGINGAGMATCLAIFLYNTLKLYFVYRKFKIWPFTIKTLQIAAVIFLFSVCFYFWEFPFHPIINIAIKSTIVTLFYAILVYKFNFSEDITKAVKKYLKLN